MNSKNLFSVYSVVSNLAFAVAAPLLIFCWGGVRLINYFGLPGYLRTVSMLLGVIVMVCSFVRFFANIIRVIDKQAAQAQETKPRDLNLGKTSGSETAKTAPRNIADKHVQYGVPQYTKLSKKEREKRLRIMRAKAMLAERKTEENAETAGIVTSKSTPSLWEQFAEDTADKKYV